MDALLAAILRGDSVEAAALADVDVAAFCAEATQHDVLPLIADRLSAHAALPPALRARLLEASHQAVVRDMAREVELKHAVSMLADAGVKPLLVKGAALAYTHYTRPELRSRIDSDILIPPADRETAHALLTERLGYVASIKPSGELTATQMLYGLRRGELFVHLLDVHWRLASPQVFANVLSYEDLAATAVPLPRLGTTARGPSNVHALLIACMHRVAHHLDSARFKWLYDIHLIASCFTDDEWEQFVALMSARRVTTVCRHSLELTGSWFQTPIPSSVWSDPRFGEAHAEEPTAAYLTSRSQAQRVADDLRSLTSWGDRARLLREHLFPPADYMHEKYAPTSAAPLPILYAVRFLRGALKWLRFGTSC